MRHPPTALVVLAFVLGACGGSAARDEDTAAVQPPSTARRDSGDAAPTPPSVPDSVRRAGAEHALANARELCDIREEDPHLVVECKYEIPFSRQLEFAEAIANSDAVLTGKRRNIYFYLPGGRQFAQADPLHGVRLKD